MADLPQGWATADLEELGSIYCGQSPPTGEVNTTGIGTLYLTGPEQWDGRVLHSRKWTTSPKRIVPDGCIFITVKGAGVGTLFPGPACAIGRDIYAFHPAPPLSLDFIRYALLYTIQEVVEQATGLIPGLSRDHLVGHAIALPPLAEQQRIVAKLEVLLGKVDACRKRLEKIPVILKRFRQSVLAAACSGRLTADWREANHETVSVAQTLPGSRDSEGLPETWVWRPLGEYVDNLDGKRIPVSAIEREERKGDFPYYGASGVIDSIDGFTHEGEFVLIGEDGANLLSRSTPIAFIAKGQIWVNNHAHVLRFKHGMPNLFLVHYINSIDLAPYVTGTAQPKFNQANMNTIPIPLPPRPEQDEIVRRVDALFALADQIGTRYAKVKTHVDRLTRSILAKAFRGDLVPQDPNDEPAAVLLERIKSQWQEAGAARSQPRRKGVMAAGTAGIR